MTSYLLLSAGIGRSMKTKGAKSLLPYDGVSVLEHQVKTIRSVDNNADICIVAGFQFDRMLKSALSLDIKIINNHEYEKTNQAESIKIGLNIIKLSDVFIIHGDVVFNQRAIRKTRYSHVVKDNSSDKRKIGICYQNKILKNMSYGLEHKWGQIFYVSKDDFVAVKSIANSIKSNRSTSDIINIIVKHTKIIVNDDNKVRVMEINKTYENSYY